MCHHYKTLNKGYNFASNLASILGMPMKLWASKMMGIPISKILGFLIWESKEKWHLSATLVASHKEYYSGEGGGFFQV